MRVAAYRAVAAPGHLGADSGRGWTCGGTIASMLGGRRGHDRNGDIGITQAGVTCYRSFTDALVRPSRRGRQFPRDSDRRGGRTSTLPSGARAAVASTNSTRPFLLDGARGAGERVCASA